MSVIIDGDAGGTAVTSTIYEQGGCFLAKLSTSFSTDGTTQVLPFDVTVFDTNNEFNTSTYRFIPTIEGYYRFDASAYVGTLGASQVLALQITKNGSIYETARAQVEGTGTEGNNVDLTYVMYANGTTDYFQVTLSTSTSDSVLNSFAYFSGHLVRKA